MSPAFIIERVAGARGVGVRAVRWSGLRYKAIAKARHEAMWLIRETTKISYPDIGTIFGNMDHTTVMSAVRKIERQIAMCPAYGVELFAIVGHGSFNGIDANEVDVLQGEIAAIRARLAELEIRLSTVRLLVPATKAPVPLSDEAGVGRRRAA